MKVQKLVANDGKKKNYGSLDKVSIVLLNAVVLASLLLALKICHTFF